MNALLVYPEIPDTFWSFKYALKFVGRKSSFPPLGLLTLAAMFPNDWNPRLVDLNVRRLRKRDLAWADLVFVSAMTVQRQSVRDVIHRCQAEGLRVVAGGPLFTCEPDAFPEVEHLVLNEGEVTFPEFLRDFQQGTLKPRYTTHEFPDLRKTPAPLWHLAELKKYGSMNVQYSRGCPYNCEFCNVTSMFGRQPRTKTPEQIIAELDGLWQQGWRDRVFFVDDNFLGNKRHLKEQLLPALIDWQTDHPKIPFNTEISINLADDEELMGMMTRAGFDTVFIGIETPDEDSLKECHKTQNRGRNLIEDIHRIQRAGLQVQGGFIVGFDSDPPNIFQRQIEFIQKSGIVTAMVGLLEAAPGTLLYDRLKKENRLIETDTSGDNADGVTNIKPKMDLMVLRQGYQEIMNTIYSPKHYYRRVKTLLQEYKTPRVKTSFSFHRICAAGRSVLRLGIFGRERFHYWRLMLWTIFRRPSLLPLSITLSIYGYHFRKVSQRHLQ